MIMAYIEVQYLEMWSKIKIEKLQNYPSSKIAKLKSCKITQVW